MEIRSYIIEILNSSMIIQYLSETEKEYIISEYAMGEEAFEEAFRFENEKIRIAVSIFYNIVLKRSDIKNRKLVDSKICVFTIKNLAKIFSISEKGLYKSNNILYEKFPEFKESSKKHGDAVSEEVEKINKILEPILRSLKNHRRKTEPQAVSQKNLINIFLTTFEFIKLLYPDKGAIKIKEYLAHVQLNLFLAGHNVQEEKLESIFGEFVKHLNLALTDGRNEEDFIKVKDNYGKVENKVYIELGR